MIVVGVAMIGSLTVLPALLAKLGDRVEKGRIPFLHRLRRDRAARTASGRPILTPALRHPRRLGGRRGRACCSCWRSRSLQHAHRAVRASTRCRRARRPSPRSRRSRTRSRAARTPALVAIKADADSPATQKAIAELKRAGARERPDAGPDRGRRRTPTTPRRGSRSRSPARAPTTPRTRRSTTLRNEILPATIGHGAGRDLRRHRRHGGLGRRERAAQALGAARLRLRAHVRVHPAAASRSARS